MASAYSTVAPPRVDASAAPSIQYKAVRGACRRIVRFRGGTRLSEVQTSGEGFGDPAEAFDANWLRSDQWPSVHEPKGTLTVADLFCGSGGLTLGTLEAARALQFTLRPVLAIDNDEDALAVYRDNFEPKASFSAAIENLIGGEVGAATLQQERTLQRTVTPPDLLLAGPPCQGHSDLNNHTRRDDPRNGLIARVVRFAELFSPKHVVIENVQGIRHDKSGAFQQATAQLESLGYNTSSFLLEGSEIGLPQRRRRCFLIGSRTTTGDLSRILRMHSTKPRTFDWACGDLQTAGHDNVFDTAAKVHAENQRRMNYLIENDIYDLPDEERPDCHRLKAHAYRSVYGRLRGDSPSPTITTGFGSPGQGRYTHPRVARTITPHEAARLQFIPDFFEHRIEKRKRLQKLIGNAVPSKLAFAVTLDLLLHG